MIESVRDSDDPTKKPMGQLGTPAVRALGVPGAGGLVTAADLALLYQPLVNGGKVWGGGQILQAETINRATTPHTDARHFTVFGSIANPADFPAYAEAGLQTLPKLVSTHHVILPGGRLANDNRTAISSSSS
jgi:CubicO group peptidase (beta-lactamase class C family)